MVVFYSGFSEIAEAFWLRIPVKFTEREPRHVKIPVQMGSVTFKQVLL